jgi:hypothetical protein
MAQDYNIQGDNDFEFSTDIIATLKQKLANLRNREKFSIQLLLNIITFLKIGIVAKALSAFRELGSEVDTSLAAGITHLIYHIRSGHATRDQLIDVMESEIVYKVVATDPVLKQAVNIICSPTTRADVAEECLSLDTSNCDTDAIDFDDLFPLSDHNTDLDELSEYLMDID